MNAFYEKPLLPTREELEVFLFGSPGDHGDKTSKYWLAVSGGLDSMVLMDLFASWASRNARDAVEVLHVNYGLRGEESEGDARFVEAEAKARGLLCRVLEVSKGSQPQTGIQDWARQIRYDWFAKLSGASDKVLLAHHLDDHVETILMRIMRGSGLSGLQAMRNTQGLYWRPFLEVPQKTLQEIAAREKIQHREDSSNAKLDYSRNRIRKLILPALEEMFPGAGKNLKDLAEAGQEWNEFHQKVLMTHETPESPEAWRDLGFHPASALVMARMKEASWNQDVGRAWLFNLYQALVAGSSTVIQLDPQHQVRVKKGKLVLERRLRGHSSRWEQYAKELTRTSLSALLSPGSHVLKESDPSLGKPEKRDAIPLDNTLLDKPLKPQK